MKYKYQLISINILLFLFCIANIANAAILYLSPETGQYQLGDTFKVELRIDTEGECVNTVEGNLQFSQDVLRAVDFSQGNSIITFWISEPEINQELGLISFSGGIPNGYCGQVLGDPEASNLLGRIIFRVPEIIAGEPGHLAQVKFLNTSQVFLNDGKGTKTRLELKDANFNILTEKLEVSSKDEWQEEIEKDDTPPEAFKVEVSKNPAIFEGKYFITFSTTDKQTGIDHYEVKEGKKDWKKVISPYLLENQKLTDDIQVKAVDKAGNERIKVLGASRGSNWERILYLIAVLISVLIIIKITQWLLKKYK